MSNNQNISINFLPLKVQQFKFKIFKLLDEDLTLDNFKNRDIPINKFRLPIGSIQKCINEYDIYKDHFISFKKVDRFEGIDIYSNTNIYITLHYLKHLLLKSCENALNSDEYDSTQTFKNKRFNFYIESNDLGKSTIWLEPYYLKTNNLFGFLIGYEFKKNPEVPFNKEVQIKSLSLNASGIENKNYYLDYYNKLCIFIREYLNKLFPFIAVQ